MTTPCVGERNSVVLDSYLNDSPDDVGALMTTVTTINIVALHHTDDEPHLLRLEGHLSPSSAKRLIDLWHAGKIGPGEDRKAVLARKLAEAHLVLLLVSAEFNRDLDPDLSDAIARAMRDARRVIPIVVRPCAWTGLPFDPLQPLPRDRRPLVKDGTPIDRRFASVAADIRQVVLDLLGAPSSGRASVPTPPPSGRPDLDPPPSIPPKPPNYLDAWKVPGLLTLAVTVFAVVMATDKGAQARSGS